MKKLLILFLFFTIALSTSAQISIKHNGTLRDLFSILQSKYGYSFMYSNSDINDQQIVKINLTNSDIETLFKQITESTNTAYAIKNRQVVIKKAEPKAIRPGVKAEVNVKTKKTEPKLVEQKKEETPIKNQSKEVIESEQLKAEMPLPNERKDSIVKKDDTIIHPKKDAEPKLIEQTGGEVPIGAYSKEVAEPEQPKAEAPPSDKRKNSKKNTVIHSKTGNEAKSEIAQITNSDKDLIEKSSPWKSSLTTNLLYDLAATLNLGVEVKYTEQYALAVNGGWMRISLGDQKRYRIWLVNPELRCYFTSGKRYYLGGEMHMGELNVKFSATGNQGRFVGGGVTFGYVISMGNSFKLDLGIGLGYTRYKYDTYYYDYDSENNVKKESKVKSLWLPKPGVTLVWIL